MSLGVSRDPEQGLPPLLLLILSQVHHNSRFFNGEVYWFCLGWTISFEFLIRQTLHQMSQTTIRDNFECMLPLGDLRSSSESDAFEVLCRLEMGAVSDQ
jgi:hypothetical protein